jgi:tetratricopeptide (TPR) repeat protein
MGLFDRKTDRALAAPPPASPAEERFQAAMALSNQERHAEAAAAFRRVLELDPNFRPETVHYGLALAYDGMGDSERAVAELRNVLSINPSQVDAHFILGTIYARTDRLEAAVREYETVLYMRPGHELAGEIQKSIAQWKLDLAGGPLAGLKEDMDRFIRQAEQQFHVTLDLSPGSLRVLDGLIDGGWDLQNAGVGALHIAGTYVGEVIIRNIGGRWMAAPKVEESEIGGLRVSGVKPFFIALEKFRRGRAASLLETYNILAAELEKVRAHQG